LNSGGASTRDTIERAQIDRTTGTIGEFATLPVRLNQPRAYLTSAVIGDCLYLFGGYNGGNYTNSIERAKIKADGSLSPFELLTTTLPYAMGLNGTAVIGEYVYLVGGYASAVSVKYVLRARIDSDGSIGAFTRTGDMQSAVYGPSVARIGNYLWALGGYNSGNYATGQRAPIRPDGTLGPWETSQPGGRNILPTGASEFTGPPYIYKDRIFLASGYSNGVNVSQGTLR
jgi:hypothetical protein